MEHNSYEKKFIRNQRKKKKSQNDKALFANGKMKLLVNLFLFLFGNFF